MNFGLRLDEILDEIRMTAHTDAIGNGAIDTKAKQSLTSLIKELVEEAKPEKRTPDYYSDSIDLYSRQCAANSWNKAIDQFEQNILKELEEV